MEKVKDLKREIKRFDCKVMVLEQGLFLLKYTTNAYHNVIRTSKMNISAHFK